MEYRDDVRKQVLDIGAASFGHSEWHPTEKGVTGIISIRRNGFGFVRRDDGKGSVFISARKLRWAIHGDKVEIEVGPGKDPGKKEGRVTRILERKTTEMVGEMQKVGTDFLVNASNGESIIQVHVPDKHVDGVKEGSVVVISLLSELGKALEGSVKEVLSAKDQGVLELQVALRKQGFSDSFPLEVLEEALKIPLCVSPEDLAGREDLRDLLFITIDGESSSDFDDAVCIEKLPAGFRLRVSIADVSHYVLSGSVVESEAIKRGTSVYFPGGQSLPMLPETMSSGICSLNPGVDRLAVTVDMFFDLNGELEGSIIYTSVITSKARLTYGSVARAFMGDSTGISPDILEQLVVMDSLAMLLFRHRKGRGSIGFDSQDTLVSLDCNGLPTGISPVERTKGHFIIEQFMLAANEEIGRYALKQSMPFIYRVHPGPDNEKYWDLYQYARKAGFSIPPCEPAPYDIQALLSDVAGSQDQKTIEDMALRCMQKAHYSTKDSGHFGLATWGYTHFTSPIRRLADLFVHRMLKKSLSGEDFSEMAAELQAIADQASSREVAASDAEREVIRRNKLRYCEGMVGEVHAASVSGLSNSGLYVKLEESLIEGFVPIDTLPEIYEFDDKQRTIAELFGDTRYMVGDRVAVEVVRIDYNSMRVVFSLLGKGVPTA